MKSIYDSQSQEHLLPLVILFSLNLGKRLPALTGVLEKHQVRRAVKEFAKQPIPTMAL